RANFGHETEHAACDFLVQASARQESGEWVETGEFLTQLAPALQRHRLAQARRLAAHLPLHLRTQFTTVADYFGGSPDAQADVVPYLMRSLERIDRDNIIQKSIPLFFVSTYALGGDRMTHPDDLSFSA